jgi:PEP-CTERM motif-containing protein
MPTRQHHFFIVLVLSLSFFAASAFGQTVLSENFNELTPTLSVTSAGAFSTINGTNVDIVGGALFGSLCAAPEAGNCIDMDGTGGNPQGQLQSNKAFGPGKYLLSFDLIGDQRGSTASVTVSFGNYDQTFNLASGDDTGGIVINQVVTVSGSPSNLLFVSNTPGNVGLVLDNVTISATPEPGTFGLMLLGIGGALVMLKRIG